MKHLGIIGLGTMGANLARNAAHSGATVAVFNRTAAKTDSFIELHGSEGNFIACDTLEKLEESLPKPRVILLMVKAGDAVDELIEELLPHLSPGDVLIDGGNSHYRDTERRQKELAAKNMHLLGMGISGGEEGALHGPSLMPGGAREAYDLVEPLLKSMAADDGEHGKCVAYVGPGGSGHFVKMVHNGIEYGVMQLLAETYDLLKEAGGLSNVEMVDVFAQWNQDYQSFLIEITASILRHKDEMTGKDLIDVIKDTAAQKGTGRWTTEAAMQYGVAIPTINAAVDARIFSADTLGRTDLRSRFTRGALQQPADPARLTAIVKDALELSTLLTYVQGFELIQRASTVEGWSIDRSEVARLWRGGCIIRSSFLSLFQTAFRSDNWQGIAEHFDFHPQMQWRLVLAQGASQGIPLPAMAASLAYFDTATREKLPSNLIQAQRDFFGAHTYERIDKEGAFHTEWKEG